MTVSCPHCHRKAQFAHQRNGYQYYACRSCFFLFLSPQPARSKINRYYQTQFNYSAGIQNEHIIRTQSKHVLHKLSTLHPNAKTLLDIGSGNGYFLDEAKKKYPVCFGVEPSTRLSAYSRSTYRLQIYEMEIEIYLRSYSSSRFDVITLNHIVEHLKDPLETIIRLSKLLNQRGILYIETPNLQSHLYDAEKENYTFLTPPEHLWIFSQKSIEAMLPEELSIIHAETYSYPEHFMGILKSYLNSSRSLTSRQNKPISPISPISQKPQTLFKKTKYILFDKLLSPLFTPLLNLNRYGSILELYIRKK